MSFVRYKTNVEVGDTVFVYLGPKNIYPLNVVSGECFQTKYGALRHDDIIGKAYGSLIQCAKGYLHILHATPELWTLTLPHRTQILYTTDISFIITQLDLKPGSIVCEAGTGSGSLSHAIASTIAPNGRLFTFDFHEERVIQARQEFQSHGLSDLITITHKDVCSDGFGINGVADAIFLDLPHPWNVIQSAKNALKNNGGRICCFSPCVEQVQKTCVALRDNQFFDVDTYECVLKSYDVKQVSLPVYHFPNSDSLIKDNEEQDVTLSDSLFCSYSDIQSSKKLKIERNESTSRNDESDSNYMNASNSKQYLSCHSTGQMPGHTGFLTFAVKYQ